MSMHLGYLVGTAIFAAVFAVAVVVQIRARQFHPFNLLGDNHRDDDGRNNNRRLRGSNAKFS
jgi:hypothetical protein